MKKQLLDNMTHDFADLKENRAHGEFDYPVAVYLNNLKDLYDHSVSWHWHEEIEIVLVKEGKAIFSANDNSFELTEGQGLFLNRNVLHSMHPCEGENCIFYSLVFHLSIIAPLGNNLIANKYIFPLMTSLRFLVLDSSVESHKEMLAFALAACKVNEQQAFGYEFETRKYLTDFWLMLLKYQQQTQTEPSLFNPKIISDTNRTKAAMSFIQKHYTEPITLMEIADSIHVSKSECCRCFKRVLNLSPFEYLMQYRIFMAANIIVTSDYASFSDLAIQVGFNSSSYFNKVFKKYAHCTPSEYRKKHLSDSLHHHILDIRKLPSIPFEDTN